MGRKTMDGKHQLKRKMVSEDDCEQIKRRSKPLEDKAGPSTATPEGDCFEFDVFISFRGKDTRNSFTSHLHERLKAHGIATFIDNEDLKKGERISNLLNDIERSKIFVPVFSKNYADSKWCLKEIARMVEIHNKAGEKRPIIPIFYHVDLSDVKHCRGSFGKAFKKHQQDKELGEEEINEWKAALKAAGGISGFCLSDTEGNEAEEITRICKDVSNRLYKRVPFDIKAVGISPCIDTLKQMLERENDGICMIGICGLGGIGKTTLAMAVYNELCPTFEGSCCFLPDIRSTSENREGLPSLQVRFIEDVLGQTMNILRVEQGVSLIKRRLRGKKVLLILDDVDDERQLEAFTANYQSDEKWFSEGSKIIVTTRDKKVLINHGLQPKDIYYPQGLDVEHSLQLFCRHAFHRDQPRAALSELSQQVVEVAQHLPLALIVFGSLFCDIEEKDWEEKLEKLKSEQHKEVHERLKISYDSLDHSEKSVFLDIACFFIGREKEYPVHMWQACGYFPTTTLLVLQHKSLVKINKEDEFEMHDQIRDMGRMIVKQEGGDDPLKYSRPWNDEQMLKVLWDAKVSMGNPFVHRLNFRTPPFPDENGAIWMSWKAIEAMPQLRMITRASFNDLDDEEEIRLPSNIRWFQWRMCPDETFTFHNNRHEKLCVLDLAWGLFREFGSRSMKFPNLKVLHLTGCKNLIRTPDFTHLPSLEVLVLNGCSSLTEMDESIGHLQKLVKLSMSHCESPKGLPAGLCKLTSLEYLDLRDCESLREVPDSLGELNNNLEISIDYCSSLEKLPNSARIRTDERDTLIDSEDFADLPDNLGNLVRLDGCQSLRSLPDSLCYGMSVHFLSLRRCESLEEIPDFIGMRLECLKVLTLSGCTSLTRICPELIGKLKSLSHLSLSGCRSIEELPECIGRLLSLEESVLSGCSSLKSIPESIGDLKSLIHLSLDGCHSIEELPECIGRLLSLEEIVLYGCTSLKSIPESIGDLKSLKHLNLENCQSIEELPECTGRLLSLEELFLSGCTSLKSIPESIGDLKNLRHLFLWGCRSLEQLPESMEGLDTLKVLHICGGMWVKKVPDFVGKLERLQKLKLSGFEEIPEFIGGLPILKGICIIDCPKLESLPQLPSSLIKLDLSWLLNLKSLERLELIACDSLDRGSMDMLSQATFERLERLITSGEHDSSGLVLFGLPRSNYGPVRQLLVLFSLTEELPSNTPHIDVTIQVQVEGKIVTKGMWKAFVNHDDWATYLRRSLQLEDKVWYTVDLGRDEEIFRYVEEGQAMLRVPTTYGHYQLEMVGFCVRYGYGDLRDFRFLYYWQHCL